MDLVVGPRTTAGSRQSRRGKSPVNDNISLDACFTTADRGHPGARRVPPELCHLARAFERSPPSSPLPAPVLRPVDSSPALRHHCPNATKIYREEDNQQELFRMLTSGLLQPGGGDDGKHRGGGAETVAVSAASRAEVLRCMDEMERIKPIINAEAETYRMRLPEAPRVRPPPVHADPPPRAGARTRDRQPRRRPHRWNDSPRGNGTFSPRHRRS